MTELRNRIIIEPMKPSLYTTIETIENKQYLIDIGVFRELGDKILRELSAGYKFEIISYNNGFTPSDTTKEFKILTLGKYECYSPELGKNKHPMMCTSMQMVVLHEALQSSSVLCSQIVKHAYVVYYDPLKRYRNNRIELTRAGVSSIDNGDVADDDGYADTGTCANETKHTIAVKVFKNLRHTCKQIKNCYIPTDLFKTNDIKTCSPKANVCNARSIYEFLVPIDKLELDPQLRDWRCDTFKVKSPGRAWLKDLKDELACGLGDVKTKFLPSILPELKTLSIGNYQVVCPEIPAVCKTGGVTDSVINTVVPSYTEAELMTPSTFTVKHGVIDLELKSHMK